MTLSEFKALVEKRISEVEGDPNKAPFGLNNEESFAWTGGAASALTWVLEMLPAEFT